MTERENDHDEKVSILEFAIEEQRSTYGHLNNIYDQLRVKALAMIAGEIAIITFVFSGKNQDFFPEEVDRLIFFYCGIAFLGLAFALMLWIISSVSWKVPHGFDKSRRTKHLKANYPQYKKFLEYLNDDYVKVNKHCAQIVSTKCKAFNHVIYMLPAGVIIVLVITKFGGRI